ncbi:hypothetical protein M885DRAFT_607180 [Pelagophyceae sp. CCMP2097]|nr:hypothetical protein M885DRAFT_607180 [Pelagophyceae sp. CCMP2097]
MHGSLIDGKAVGVVLSTQRGLGTAMRFNSGKSKKDQYRCTNASLVRAKTVKVILGVSGKAVQSEFGMDYINFATAMHRLAKVHALQKHHKKTAQPKARIPDDADGPGEEAFDESADAGAPNVESPPTATEASDRLGASSLLRLATAHVLAQVWRARELANVAWAIGALGFPFLQKEDAVSCLRAIIENVDVSALRPQELSNILWALARWRLVGGAAGDASTFDGADVSTFDDFSFFKVLVDSSLSDLHALNAQHVAILAWAVAATLPVETEDDYFSKKKRRRAIAAAALEAAAEAEAELDTATSEAEAPMATSDDAGSEAEHSPTSTEASLRPLRRSSAFLPRLQHALRLRAFDALHEHLVAEEALVFEAALVFEPPPLESEAAVESAESADAIRPPIGEDGTGGAGDAADAADAADSGAGADAGAEADVGGADDAAAGALRLPLSKTRIETFGAQDVSNVAWAFAKARHRGAGEVSVCSGNADQVFEKGFGNNFSWNTWGL